MKKFFTEFKNIDGLFKSLESPENKYRIYPIMHNLCDKETDIEKDISLALSSGAGGAVTNTTWRDTEWVFNPENTKKLKTAAEYIKSQGMGVWMYDDYYYPSGLANGYAVKDHPEYFAQSIAFTSEKINSGEERELEEHIFAGVYDENFTLLEKFNKKAEHTGLLIVFYVKKHIEDIELGKAKGHLNHLDKNAVRSFIDNAFEPVQESVGLDNFDAIFTDEPTLTSNVISFARGKVDFSNIPAPYVDILFSEYERMWDEDLRENLMCLFTGLDNHSKTVRIRYYRTLAEVARRDYIDQIADYLKEKGTLSSGHFLLEEGLKYHVGYYADYMRVVAGQDIPGCDILCADAQKFFEKGSGFGTSWAFAAKYPASLSHLLGHNVTMMEICPVNYPEKIKIDPYKEFMGLSTYAIFSGITHYNAYGYNFITDENQHNHLNEYVGRLLTVLRNAKAIPPVSVYYPISSMQSLFATPTPLKEGEVDFYPETEELENKMEELLNILYNMHTDFVIVPEEFIDKTETPVLLVPFMEFLSPREIKEFKALEEKGVEIIYIDTLPTKDIFNEKIKNTCKMLPLNKVSTLDIVPDMPFTVKGENIFASPYEILNKKFLFVINTKESDTVISVTGENIIYDPEENKLYENTFTLKGERGIFIFER